MVLTGAIILWSVAVLICRSWNF